MNYDLWKFLTYGRHIRPIMDLVRGHHEITAYVASANPLD